MKIMKTHLSGALDGVKMFQALGSQKKYKGDPGIPPNESTIYTPPNPLTLKHLTHHMVQEPKTLHRYIWDPQTWLRFALPILLMLQKSHPQPPGMALKNLSKTG